MKNLRFLLILGIGAMIFQACSKDEEEGGSATKADLIGVWTTSETEVSFIADGEDYEDESLASDFESDDSTVEFKDDDTYITDEGTEDEETGTWSLSSDGSTITLDPNSSQSYEIEVLSASSSQLKVRIEEDFTAFAGFFGIEVENEFIVIAEQTLTK